MTRVNLLLLLAVLASALYLVGLQYESRRLFTEIEKANAEGRKLVTDNERLQVEKRAQATPSRVEKLAREQLRMSGVTPAVTHYVTYASGAIPVSNDAATAAPTTPGSSGVAR